VVLKSSLDQTEYNLILNPDVIINDNCLDKLYEFMNANKNIGLVMPKVFYPDGKVQYLCRLLPSPVDLFVRRFLRIKFLQDKHDFIHELRFTAYDKPMAVPHLSGCFMFVRNEVFKKAGFFDDRYFLYMEDTDLCRRINKYCKLFYYPAVSIIHDHGRGSYKGFKHLKYHVISAIKYFNKWGWFVDSERNMMNRKALDDLGFKAADK
jgi:GT2 family glycosyltransferase